MGFISDVGDGLDREECIEEELKSEAQEDRFRCKELIKQIEEPKLKRKVFSDQSPCPKDPCTKFYSMDIITYAWEQKIIKDWDIQFYRKLRRLKRVTMKQMIHKIRIDLLIRDYFSNAVNATDQSMNWG